MLHTNLKAVGMVVVYYSDGVLIKFPVGFRIYSKDHGKRMSWQRHHPFEPKKKYLLAIEISAWAVGLGFPGCLVLADSWYGISPFVKARTRLKLGYVLEITTKNTGRMACTTPKLTPTGRLAKRQDDLTPLGEYFTTISTGVAWGVECDRETGKPTKILYQAKVSTLRLNAFPGNPRLVESCDPATHTRKYFLSNQLHWDTTKILTVYSYRWGIEEFFRNAKQLTGLEGAMLRSEQGVALTVCTVVSKWLEVAKDDVNRIRKPRKALIALEIADGDQLWLFA